jgi:hypothetical protein
VDPAKTSRSQSRGPVRAEVEKGDEREVERNKSESEGKRRREEHAEWKRTQ